MKNKWIQYLLKIMMSALALNIASAYALAESTRSAELERVDRIPADLVDAFNSQVKSELEGAHFYLGLANHFYERSLDGFGHWFTQQYYEELNHARLMMDYLKKKNAHVLLTSLDTPPATPSFEPLAILEQSLGVEQTQSDRINALQALAITHQTRDAATFLQWFIDEQVEEEDSFQNVIDRLKLVQNSQEGLLLIDKELALRPAAVIWANGQPLPPH